MHQNYPAALATTIRHSSESYVNDARAVMRDDDESGEKENNVSQL